MTIYLTVAQAAERLGYDGSHVNRLIRTGKLRGQRHGWAWLIDVREVDRYAQAHPRTNMGAPTPQPTARLTRPPPFSTASPSQVGRCSSCLRATMHACMMINSIPAGRR